MKLIDRYIFFKFLGTFFTVLMLIMLIAIVFDVSEKLEDFVSKGASGREIFMDYYVNFIAFYGNLFSSLIVFISTIWFTSRMTARTEIVAILSASISYRRLMLPFFYGALVVFGLSMWMNHFVIPKTNIDRLNFENTYINNNQNQDLKSQDIHFQVKPNHVIFLGSFNERGQSGYNFSYEVYEKSRMINKLDADFIRYDSIKKIWRLDNWVRREILEDGTELLSTGRRLDTIYPFLPEDVVPKLFTTSMMDTPELLSFIDTEVLRGSEKVNYHEIELYKRTAFPFSTFILILIAVSLSTKKSRGGLGLNIALGLLLSTVYIFLMQVSTTFSTHGDLTPMIAVWVPNIVFAILGIFLYKTAPK
ncbi:MAG: LptF/LptG family permease [Schleiferiaceae bacterium]|jgi:lipopolysaccharide export system permease protein